MSNAQPAGMSSQTVAAQILATPTPAADLTPGVAPVGRQYGVVVSVQAGPPQTLTINLAGSLADIPGVSFKNSYTPTAGDTVLIDHVGSDLVVDSVLANAAVGFLQPLGMTGATQATRYVGATTSGAPVSGAFLVGDFAIAQDGRVWVCTVAGSPGTWYSPPLITGVGGITGTYASGLITMQAGTQSGTTDSGGQFTVTFPHTFPNGLLAIFGTNDAAVSANQDWVVNYLSTTSTKAAAKLQLVVSTTAVAVNALAYQVSWLAFGW